MMRSGYYLLEEEFARGRICDVTLSLTQLQKRSSKLSSNMSVPLIGITAYSRNEAGEVSLPGAYLDAVLLAGGTPLILPPQPITEAQVDRILDSIDGLIFAGGGDINPSMYGGENHQTLYLMDQERDEFELALARAVLKRNLPALGICRGMQILSVASGAALIPHVPDVYGESIAHRLDHPRRPIHHPVMLVPDSQIAQMMANSEVTVMSWHHQAVRQVPPGWRSAASAADGLVEAIERIDRPWQIGVQWHPELSPEDPAHQRIFQAFVQAAADLKQAAADSKRG